VPLQLLVPSLPTRVARLEVVRWVKQPGDAIAFGDEICELEVREITSVDRDVLAEGSDANRSAALKRRTIVGLVVMVRASDEGRLVDLVAATGDVVAVGDRLGHIAPATSVAAGSDQDGPAFHAVAEVVGRRDLVERNHVTVRRRVGRLYRRTLAHNPRIRQFVRNRRRAGRPLAGGSATRLTETHTSVRRGESRIVETRDAPTPRWGVQLVGACDLPALLDPDPSVIDDVRGTMVIHRAARRISGARSDMLLQTLGQPPAALVAEVTGALGLPPSYFSPDIFDPNLEVGSSGRGPVPLRLTVLSAAADVVRPAYRHKEHGLIVDPGGFWLDGEVLTNAKQHEFRRYLDANFDRIGKLTPEESVANYRRLIPVLRERTGGEVMVFNVLTIEPGDRTHNYQLRKVPEGARRRRFHIAQAELSAELGYHVVDVDRALKRAGAAGQVDFAHFPREQYPAVAAEAFAAFRQAGLL
jgi:hypothetical protein